MQSSFATNSLINLFVPILNLLFFWFAILCKFKFNYRNPICKRYLILSTVVILMTLHPTLVKQVLDFFQCTNPIAKKMYLIADVDIQCGTSNHYMLIFFLAIPSLVLYIFGIPFMAGLNLFFSRHKLDEPHTRQTLGFLYANYEKYFFWWEIVIILRLVAMACISVLFEGNPSMQATLGSQVLFIAIFLHMICRPFEEDILDNVETCSLASSVIALTCGNLLLNESTPPIWKMTATIMIFLSVISFVGYIFFNLIYIYRNKKQLDAVQAERRRETIDVESNADRLTGNPMLRSPNANKPIKAALIEFDDDRLTGNPMLKATNPNKANNIELSDLKSKTFIDELPVFGLNYCCCSTAPLLLCF